MAADMTLRNEKLLRSCSVQTVLHSSLNKSRSSNKNWSVLDVLDNVDLSELGAMMAESVVDLILLAPEEEQAKLLAATIAQLGQAFLEKRGAIDGDSVTAH
jgi:hypothetical protein